MNAITHVAQGAGCAPWCPACAQERAAAAYRKLAPKCQTCDGAGVVPGFHNVDRLFRKSGDRFVKLCPDCSGSGVVTELPVCPTCAAIVAERTGGMAYYGETLPDCDHQGAR